MIESDSSVSTSTQSRVLRTRTSGGSLQRCSVWVQELQNKNDAIFDSGVIKLERDPEISQDEYSESSDISQRRMGSGLISSMISQDDTEVDTSVASEEPYAITIKSRESGTRQSFSVKPVCGWKGCDYSTTDLLAYVSHVSSHLPNIKMKICEETEDEEVYCCMWELCEFETPNADEVSRHVNFHSYHTKMKCLGSVFCKELKLPDCHYGTDGVNLVPDLPSVFECCWENCSYTSNNSNSFFIHVQLHANESDGVSTRDKGLIFLCQWRGCKTEVRKKMRLNEHIRVHSKEKAIACPTCGSLFASRLKLTDHRRRQSQEDKNTFQCSHCSGFYPSERLLRDHMRHHVNHYKCQFCDMTCPSPWTLAKHIRHRHISDKPFHCDYCSYKAKTQFNLKRHMATHLSTLNFSCEDCDYKCRSASMLNWHYRKEHDAPTKYCCHMCDCRYLRGAYLTKHLMKKHNFRWPSGHSRFRYKRDEDGLYRLQTVRYESLDVVEDINRGDGEEKSFLKSNDKFLVKTKLVPDGFCAARVLITRKHGEEEDDDPLDVDEYASDSSSDKQKMDVKSPVKESSGASMPLLDADSPPPSARKVLISIDEVDTSGNIIRSNTLEADELNDVGEAHVIMDGDCLL